MRVLCIWAKTGPFMRLSPAPPRGWEPWGHVRCLLPGPLLPSGGWDTPGSECSAPPGKIPGNSQGTRAFFCPYLDLGVRDSGMCHNRTGNLVEKLGFWTQRGRDSEGQRGLCLLVRQSVRTFVPTANNPPSAGS